MSTRTISISNTFLMSVLIIFWGSSFIVVKIALNEGLTPVATATFRFLLAGGLFLIALLLKKNRKRNYNLLIERKDAPALFVLALTGITIFFVAQYTGIEMASPSIAAILVCLLSPILITVFSARMFKEHLTRKQILGAGIAAVGTFTIVTNGTFDFSSNMNFFLGSLILLSTPVLWTVYTLLGKKIMEKYDPFLVVSYVTILGGLCLIPFSLTEYSIHQIFTMSRTSWLAILFLSITCSLLGYYIWFYVLRQVDAAITSSFLFAEPLVTILFEIAFLEENLSLFILIGGLLIFTGVYLVTTKQMQLT